MQQRWLRPVAETTKPALVMAIWLSVSVVGLAPGVSSGPTNTDRASTGQNSQADQLFFSTAVHCTGCHTGLVSQTGEDISIATDWQPSMMANSARDPYWQASVRRETQDHPMATHTIESTCATCHMPMARYHAHAVGLPATVFTHLSIGQKQSPLSRLAADGVSCTLCHQIQTDRLQAQKKSCFAM